jgi:hypothetical protein
MWKKPAKGSAGWGNRGWVSGRIFNRKVDKVEEVFCFEALLLLSSSGYLTRGRKNGARKNKWCQAPNFRKNGARVG